MRTYCDLAVQILFALVLVLVGIGAALSAVLPFWIARHVAAIFGAATLLGLAGLLVTALLWCGMFLQRWDDDARMRGLLRKAGLNVG